MATKKSIKPATKEKKSEILEETKSLLKSKVAKKIAKPAVKKEVSKPVAKAETKKSDVKASSKTSKDKPVVSKKESPKKEENKKIASKVEPKSKPEKETVAEKNKKQVKKAPNQSLETILPDDKKDVKPKILAKPPVRRDWAQRPIMVNLKKEDVEKTNYSQSELEEFKGIIHKKLDEARRDFELLKESLSNKDNGTEDTSPTFKLLEDGSDVLSKEELAQLASRQQKFITNLENALIRIENKTYGVCRVTGKLISADRLRIVPHATTSIEGKMAQ
jgi:RNA polymerase-binding transcription factor DksA